MKNNFVNLLLPSLLLLAFWSCKKQESRIYLESANPVTLTASTTASQVLLQGNASKTAVTFSWTNPNYRFTTGMSSQDVTYTLQVDTAGANFTNPKRQEVSISNDLGIAYTVKDLNLLLGKLELVEDMPHQVEFRIKSSIGGSAPVYSNVVRMTLTPYLDLAVPLPKEGTLWMTGDAAPSGWQNPLATPNDVNQRFTAVSKTTYELTVSLPGGGGYKLIQKQGDWSTQYHMLAGGTWSGGEFEMKDSDPTFPGPPTAGTYKISFDFKTGKFTATKL